MVNVFSKLINYSPFTIFHKTEVIPVQRKQTTDEALKFLKSGADGEDDKANQQQDVVVLAEHLDLCVVTNNSQGTTY
jgi:hypothetical protein